MNKSIILLMKMFKSVVLITWWYVEDLLEELGRRVGDDGVGGDEVEQQHDLHSHLLPASRHDQHDVVLHLVTQSKVAARGHGHVDTEQN